MFFRFVLGRVVFEDKKIYREIAFLSLLGFKRNYRSTNFHENVMTNKNNSFQYTNHFAKNISVPSIPVFESKLDYIPRVTIAIPTYRRADLLKEAVDSALNQIGYEKYDVMVVDNNPERNDETEKLLLTYQNPRLSYYKNGENLGMAGNWNRLYEIAKGEWVVMLHDDDLLDKNYLDVLFNKIIAKCKEEYNLYIPSFNNLNLIKGENIFIPYQFEKKITVDEICYRDFKHGNIIGPPLGLCMQKITVMQLGGFNNDYYPIIDYEFYIRAAFYAKMVRLPDLHLGTYRIQRNESLKMETIRGIVVKMIEILNQLNGHQFKGIKYLWKVYSETIGYYLLQSCKNEYNLDEKNINALVASLNIEAGFFRKILFRMFFSSYRLRKRMTRLILSVCV